MKEQKLLKINFSHFPEDERSAQIPGKLFLIDNFSDPLRKSDHDDIMSFPVQVMMAIVVLCRAGKMNIKLNMHDYEVTSGSMCTIMPGSLFQLISVTDNVECAFIAINPDLIDFTKDIKMGIEYARIQRQDPVINLDYLEMEEFTSIYKALKRKLYQKDFQFREYVACNYLNIMRCNAFQHYVDSDRLTPKQETSSRKEELFMKFISEVQKHYRKERNVSFYASKLCVTPKYLSSIIRDASGKYATEWITEYVILEAKAMLRFENHSVKDVCNTLNFPNQSFFAKYFKQHTGFTPKEYKNAKP